MTLICPDAILPSGGYNICSAGKLPWARHSGRYLILPPWGLAMATGTSGGCPDTSWDTSGWQVAFHRDVLGGAGMLALWCRIWHLRYHQPQPKQNSVSRVSLLLP